MDELKAKVRASKDNYYLDIAEAVGEKSTCLRRHYGAVIVKNDEIISTGYNGSPRGCINCTDDACMRNELGFAKGRGYNICGAVHAEMNAVISAARRDMIGATIYIVGREVFGNQKYADPTPCLLCHRMLCNSGVDRVVGRVQDQNGEVRPMDLEITPETFMLRMQKECADLVADLEPELSDVDKIRAQGILKHRADLIQEKYHGAKFPKLTCEYIMRIPGPQGRDLCGAYSVLTGDDPTMYPQYPVCSEVICPKKHPELLDGYAIK